MKRTRIRLIQDLTRYDARCKIGELGYTGSPKSMWARSCEFFNGVGVDFDNGAKLDVLWKGMEVLNEKTR